MDPVKVQVAEELPPQNDSSSGLAQLYNDLAPDAARLRRCAHVLMFFSILHLCSLEGMFGLIAASSVLCCAAPGSLGTAYAARCTRIAATITAGLALSHVLFITFFASTVMPDLPKALNEACAGLHQDHIHAFHDKAPPASIAMFHDKNVAVQTVAHYTAASARKLQEVVFDRSMMMPPHEHCEQITARALAAAPYMFVAALLVESFLFLAAIKTARASAYLMLKARAMGANAL
jgi:hypothetical protein